MTSEEDFLFTAGSPAKQQGTTFQRNAPPAKEVAAAVAQLDLEGEVSGATCVDSAAVSAGSSAPVEFQPSRSRVIEPEAPAFAANPSKVVKRGPVAIDAERVARLEKKSFLQKLVDILFGWMR